MIILGLILDIGDSMSDLRFIRQPWHRGFSDNVLISLRLAEIETTIGGGNHLERLEIDFWMCFMDLTPISDVTPIMCQGYYGK